MLRNKKIVLSQVAEIAEKALPAAMNAVKDVAQKADEISGVDPNQSKNENKDYLNDLNTAEQAAREQLSGFGLDSEVYEKALNQLNMRSRAEAAKFIQDVASIASSASTTFQSVFPVAAAIYSRNVHSPERAIAILKTIAKYEAQAPGLGLFSMAEQAALGKFNPESLTLVRFSLMGAPGSKGNMNETRDLQQAFDGINLPNSDLGALLNPANMAKNEMLYSQESALMRIMEYKTIIEQKKNERLTETYEWMYEQLPDWIKNNKAGIRKILEGLSGVAEVNAIKNTVVNGIGLKGNTGLGATPTKPTAPLGFVGASTDRIKKTAQLAPGTQPVDLSAPNSSNAQGNSQGNQQKNNVQSPPLNPNAQEINKNMQSANAGESNDLVALALSSNIWSSETANQVTELLNQGEIQASVVEISYTNLTEMINTGLAGSSQYSRDTAVNTPYVTPEQMENYAKTALQGVNAWTGIIQSLLTIFAQTSKFVDAHQMQQSQVNIQKFSALMRNIEAKWRQMLKNAQIYKIKIFDISVLGVIDQKVKLLEPKYQELEANIDMMAAFNNVGADVFVMPFASMSQQMASLYFEASAKYKQAASRIQEEPSMVQYCTQKAAQMQAAGAKARAKGVTALRNLMKQQGGAAVASSNSKFIRLAEDVSKDDKEIELSPENKLDEKDSESALGDEIQAKPMDVDKYWDKLYHNKPPYGDVIVNPKNYRDKPSWEIRTKDQVKRIQ
jgi:hypothetical protein